MKKTYIAPGLTVVTFKVERGYATSGLDPERFANTIDLYLSQEADRGMETFDVKTGWGGYTESGSGIPSDGQWQQGDNHFWD